jgi:hypothetical protein
MRLIGEQALALWVNRLGYFPDGIPAVSAGRSKKRERPQSLRAVAQSALSLCDLSDNSIALCGRPCNPKKSSSTAENYCQIKSGTEFH